jgi:hypothetical protein
MAALLVLPGCPPTVVDPKPPPAVMPAYATVAGNYNRNLQGLKSLWAETSVEIKWTDDKGDSHTKQGDGHLLLQLPDRVALSLGAAGNTLLWTGCDDKRFWLFDMTGDQPRAWVGHHDAVGKPGAKPLPVPLQPHDVPHMLGLLPLPAARETVPNTLPVRPDVDWNSTLGAFRVCPQWQWAIHVEPQKWLPQLIELLDVKGNVVVASALSKPDRVETFGRSSGDWPTIATCAVLSAKQLGIESCRINLAAVSDGVDHSGDSRIQAGAFDFDRLVKAYKPAEIIDLDPPAKP